MMFKLFSTLGNLAKYVLDIYQYTSTVPTQFQKLVSHVIIVGVLASYNRCTDFFR